ncbi:MULTISPECIES: DUF481 domain-containing protein [Acidobacteriaceae]|uniref:DUF481 domain-containing protein n=1 Tax=Acidobacteriaceae TaxID=204434 RepID=UPI0020B1395B|nr:MULTISPECIES: DUF481 domain-containing protein [Acidobacteriaceae]MDW5267927.1 DUF481 domain-containing protein [Edaphobacter sp.]
MVALCLVTGILSHSAVAQGAAAAPKSDVIVFTNGDQLTGTIERGVGDSIVFKSDTAGEITVPLSKIKELRSHGSFVVIRKDEKPTKITRHPGAIAYGDNAISVETQAGTPETVPVKDLAFIIDQATYDKEVAHNPSFLHGWAGSVSGGASLVRSSQTGTSFNAGIALIRAIPTVPYLPPKTRTTFNLLESYGKLTQPVIPQTTPPTPPSEAKTSIFHADAEHDLYFTPRFYALGEVSFDHNFAQGLNMQQVYGGGFGWTPILTPVQQLDLKADIHYEMQSFIQPDPITVDNPRIPNQNLIGSTIGEAYHRNLPGKIVFTESASILPAFNNPQAYSAIATAGLALPTYKRISLGVNGTDNYLNMPATGYKKNSFQFITAIVYTLK